MRLTIMTSGIVCTAEEKTDRIDMKRNVRSSRCGGSGTGCNEERNANCRLCSAESSERNRDKRITDKVCMICLRKHTAEIRQIKTGKQILRKSESSQYLEVMVN